MVHHINDPGEQPNDSPLERHPGDRDYYLLVPRSDALSGVVLIVQADEELRHFNPRHDLEFVSGGRRLRARWRHSSGDGLCDAGVPIEAGMWLNAELDSQNSLELVDRIRFGKKRGVLNKECLHSVR